MDHTVEDCPSCIEDPGTHYGGCCICDLCSCEEYHDCVFCVDRFYSNEEVRKDVDIYCLGCKEIVHYWSEKVKCKCGEFLFYKYRSDEINLYTDTYCKRCDKVLETKFKSREELKRESSRF